MEIPKWKVHEVHRAMVCLLQEASVRPGSEGGMAGWHGWIADKGEFTDIMYEVVLELAIEETRI